MNQPSPNPDLLRTRKVEIVLQQLDGLPTLPAVAVRLLNLTGNNESKITEIVEVLQADPALTGKILSLVQSSAAGIRQTITQVRQAVVMLGFETIRNLVLSIKVFEVFQNADAQDQRRAAAHGATFNRADFWKHSIAVATAAEMLAARSRLKPCPQDAFVCGLLHDIGKIAFDTVMPKSFERVIEIATLTRGDIADAERRVIGLDHSVAGKRLAEAWNLPTLITQTIWLHNAAPMSTPKGVVSQQMIQLVGLADMIARRLHIGFSGNYLFAFESKAYQSALELTDADITAVTERLADEIERRAQAIGLYDVESRLLYLQSIANANAELGQANQTLASQNRKLAARSSCFDILTRFYQRITPAASPAQLLTEIGRVAAPFFQTDHMVLFSQDPDQRTGEVLTFNNTQSIQDSFLMPMPLHGGDQRLGRSNTGVNDFIRPALPQLEWLFTRVSAFMENKPCLFMPLLCGAEPVGGIIWPINSETRASFQTMPDLLMVAQSWGMTLRMAQVHEQQNVLTETLAASNRELGSLQQQLVRAKSLAHLGEMAAGAAHEMNNPLAVVCGRAQLLASRMHDPALKQDALQIAQQGQRLSQIITDLMEFARPGQPKPAATDIVNVVEDAIGRANERAGDGPLVAIRLEASGNIPPAMIDSHQISSALAEIILNAIQATRLMPPQQDTPEVFVQARYDALDDQLVVQVTDRGPGMSEENTKQAFAPFYSAKAAGRQRGMGLPKALRWVELHGGTIRLDSALGMGTTVVVILPQHGVWEAQPNNHDALPIPEHTHEFPVVKPN